LHVFRRREAASKLTTFTTQSTTTSPQKHHNKTPPFSKTTLKNTSRADVFGSPALLRFFSEN
jgi:hypothetical protein